jgi:hypothetical protein
MFIFLLIYPRTGITGMRRIIFIEGEMKPATTTNQLCGGWCDMAFRKRIDLLNPLLPSTTHNQISKVFDFRLLSVSFVWRK